ncbi:50S ribosomal protein L11 methyltransferase [Magnetospirillum molischianum]|uniref:Ribosomal protein L11 methyltransferase n=1 Tax=Magnetospirillum molischianum DSM 120 TaxID=1150626 RepID=H8FX89_MAGML|nr:50S ribosomal protein L11 methyltransferase [Magnetospirillum molischianum]CCG42977.1 Ribosomal protein L11 methyltransferase [Magnetospirillum molischianum DSM 120]
MPPAFPEIWRLRLTVTPETLAPFEAVFDLYAEAVTMFMEDRTGMSDGDCLWFLEGFSRTPPDRAVVIAGLSAVAAANGIDVPPLEIERVPGIDWVLANLRDFPPISAGRFFVHGSHWRGKPPQGSVAIEIDAGTAFGSGEHATTRGCLLALDMLVRRRRRLRVLDLGAGSGILGIAAAKVWAPKVLCTDIDPPAVRVMAANADNNHVGARVRACVSDGYRNPLVARGAPYDLVFSNILARPLCRFAPDLAAHLAPNGLAVLSGLLERQERRVMACHEAQGLRLKKRILVDGWATLVIGR